MDPVYSERLAPTRATRPDIIAFGVAFLIGVTAYGLLHWYGIHQIVISAAIASVMIAYSVVVARVPRLRVRMDQAGDNAYYLGLLFTLISMAVALYQFGNAVEGTGTQDAGARQIIRNFGIALFSTITGIFLRLVMHQMRVDPADVENMTRIELSDASRMVKAKLNAVSLELASFCAELQQRTRDVTDALLRDVRMDLAKFSAETTHATERMVHASVTAQTRVTRTLGDAVASLSSIAEETRGAIERLRAVSPPPTAVEDLQRLTAAARALAAALKEAADTVESREP